MGTPARHVRPGSAPSRAVKAPPSSLTIWAPAAYQTDGVAHGLLRALGVAAKGHVGNDGGQLAPRQTHSV